MNLKLNSTKDILFNNDIYDLLFNNYNYKNLPNILFYGLNGSGKNTIINFFNKKKNI